MRRSLPIVRTTTSPDFYPDADFDHGRVRASRLFRIFVDILLHADRRITRAHRMVFVGEWRTEERHDAVAHHLVNRALVPVDRLHHSFEDRVEKLARLLRITVGEQLHRTLQVGEQCA
jgi:hypothetical protein